MIALPFVDVRAFEADDQRHLAGPLLSQRHNALGDHVTAHDAAEDVDQDAFDLRSEVMILNASVTFSLVAPPPTSRKLAGSAP